MNIQTRASKVGEIYQQLRWLEEIGKFTPYLGGDRLTHADLTWFPTAVFMELLLPSVFDWTPIFVAGDEDEGDGATIAATIRQKEFPRLGGWFRKCLATDMCFVETRREIRGTLLNQKERGRFAAVKETVEAHSEEFKWKYV